MIIKITLCCGRQALNMSQGPTLISMQAADSQPDGD